MMKKRIILGASLVAMSLSSCGGTSIKVNPNKENYVVGVCQLVTHTALDAATNGFKTGLTNALSLKGRTVTFKNGNAAGEPSTCASIISSFVAEDVDLIGTIATAPLQTAYNATNTIPIVGTAVTDFGTALGIANWTGTVGSNVTGTSDLAPLDEQVNMMLEFVPNAKKVGLLYCASEPNSIFQVNTVSTLLTNRGITVKNCAFTDSNDIPTVCNNSLDCDVIYIPTDNTAASNATIIDNVFRTEKIPVFAGEEGICSIAGFATLTISYDSIGRQAGEMAAKVLLGEEDITKMAIGYDANPERVFNSAICEELGITIPKGARTI